MSLGSNHEIAYFQVRLVNLVPLPENKREFESVPKVSGDWGDFGDLGDFGDTSDQR